MEESKEEGRWSVIRLHFLLFFVSSGFVPLDLLGKNSQINVDADGYEACSTRS